MKSLRNKMLTAGLLLVCLLQGSAWATSTNNVEQAVTELQHRWEVIKYKTAEDQQEDAFKALADDARKVSEQFPSRAEPLVWEAIILSTYAGAKGGFGALGLVKQARELLLQAEKIDAGTLQGSVYTSLGSLYYQVPGWPVGFGSSSKAREYLEKALQYNPNGIDPNFFYGDFLMEEGEYAKALEVLSHAMQAPSRKGREIADEGRKKEVAALIKRAKDNL